MSRSIVAAAVIVCVSFAARPVCAQDTAPVAHEVHLIAMMGAAAAGTLDAVDPDGDPLTFSIVAPPVKGTVILTDVHTGAFLYTPGLLQNGADRFTFQASDGTLTSATAPVDVAIAEADTSNIALDKSTLADPPDPTQPGLVPVPQIVDGDLATTWNAGTSGHHFIVGLGEAKRIWRIVIHWTIGHNTDHYILYVNGDPLCSTTAGDGFPLCDRAVTTDATGVVDTVMLPAHAPSDAVEVYFSRPPSDLNLVIEVQEVEIYATESLNHASRNPPHAPGGNLHDAATFSALTDGDLATGVVGDFTTPPLQFLITTVYPAPEITRLALFWGDAYASHYQVIASAGCTTDTVVLDKTDGAGGVEILDLPTPVNEICLTLRMVDGPSSQFDLREIELYGPIAGNIAAGRPSDTSNGAATGDAAVDLDLRTTWESEPGSDPAWFVVDLGSDPPRSLCAIRLWWGDRYPKNYAVLTSLDATQPFTAYWATNVGDGGLDFVSFDMVHHWVSPFDDGLRSVRQARYVLLVADPSDVGYSLREFEVYPCPPDRP